MAKYIPPEYPLSFSDLEIVEFPEFNFDLFGGDFTTLNQAQVDYINEYISGFLFGEVTTSMAYFKSTGISDIFLVIYSSDDYPNYTYLLIQLAFPTPEDRHMAITVYRGPFRPATWSCTWDHSSHKPSKTNLIGPISFESPDNNICKRINHYVKGKSNYYYSWYSNNYNGDATGYSNASVAYVKDFIPPTKQEIIKDITSTIKIAGYPETFSSVKYEEFPELDYSMFGEPDYTEHSYEEPEPEVIKQLTAEQAQYLQNYLGAFIGGEIKEGTYYRYYSYNTRISIFLLGSNDAKDIVLAIYTDANLNSYTHEPENHTVRIGSPFRIPWQSSGLEKLGLFFKKKPYSDRTSIADNYPAVTLGGVPGGYQEYMFDSSSGKYKQGTKVEESDYIIDAIGYCVSYIGATYQYGILTFTLNLTGMGNDPCKRGCSCDIDSEDKKYKTVIEFTSDEALEGKVTIEPPELEYEWQDNNLILMLAEGETVTVDNIPAGVEYLISVESDDPCDENEYLIDNASGIIGEDSEGNPQEETEVNIEAQTGETVEQYLDRLRQRGYEALAESLKLENVEFTLQDERVKLGDLVTVDMPEFDFKAVVRVTGVKIKSQDNQTIRTISVGTPLKILRKPRI